MRVLKVYQTYAFRDRDGRGAKIGTIARFLESAGHEVTVLAVDYTQRIGSTHELKGRIHHIYLGKVIQVRKTTLSLQAISFCKNQLRRFDIVHIYGVYDLLGPIVAYYCRRFRVPYVVEPMGMYRPVARSIVTKRIYRLLVGRAVVGNADRVIATSNLEFGDLRSAGVPPGKIVVRRNGVDTSEFQKLPECGGLRQELGLPVGLPLVLYLGRISKIKGLNLLLKAFALAHDSAHLAIVGPDDRDGTLRRIRRLRHELGLEPRVSLVGPRFGQARAAVMADSDIFVLPSTHENFGNTVAEAMACGLPVVVTACCGIAEYVDGRGALVVPCTVAGLHTALRRLLADEALRQKLGSQARATAHHLGWEQPIRQQEEIYKAVCTRG